MRALLVSVLLLGAAPAAAQDCDAWSILVEDEPSRYVAGVWAGVPLDDPYAVERGVGGGLIHRMESGAHEAAFTVEDVTRIVRARSACTTVDAIDIVVTEEEIFVVHVYGVDAGTFGMADVYRWTSATRHTRIVGTLRRRAREIVPAVEAALAALSRDDEG
jgi:hypothetical protein